MDPYEPYYILLFLGFGVSLVTPRTSDGLPVEGLVDFGLKPYVSSDESHLTSRVADLHK